MRCNRLGKCWRAVLAIVLFAAINALATAQGLTLKGIAPGKMKSGPAMGKPCLDIWVSGVSAVPAGVYPYTYHSRITTSDNSLTSNKDISAFISFAPGRDELVQIQLTTLLNGVRFSNTLEGLGWIEFAGRSSQVENFWVPLPLILVPGIDPLDRYAAGGHGTFPIAEAWLRTQGYRTTLDPDPFNPAGGALNTYPTLSTLTYARNLDSFAIAASKLQAEASAALTSTFASKVIFIAHSKGSLVVRKYFVDYGTSSCKGALLIQGPHTGSVWAKYPNLGTYWAIGGDYTNLYPTYKSMRATGRGSARQYIYSPQNTELDALNNDLRSMPQDIPVQVAASLGYRTAFVHGEGSYLPDLLLNTQPGDRVVTYRSQTGSIFDPNTRQSEYVPAFAQHLPTTYTITSDHLSSMATQQTFSAAFAPFLAELETTGSSRGGGRRASIIFPQVANAVALH